jgi:hypothetical protein
MKTLKVMTVFLSLASLARARPVQDIPIEIQRTNADLVVIARAVSSKPTGDTIDFPNIRTVDQAGNQHAIKGTGVDTQFETLSIIKGDSNLKRFVLHHYYLLNPKEQGPDGPALVSFETLKGNPILLYLKKAGANYEPIAGQTDPAYSIFTLTAGTKGAFAIHFEPCH